MQNHHHLSSCLRKKRNPLKTEDSAAIAVLFCCHCAAYGLSICALYQFDGSFGMKRTRMMVTTLALAMMALGGTTAAFAAEGEAAVACTPAVEVDEMKLTDDMEGTVAVAVVAAQGQKQRYQ